MGLITKFHTWVDYESSTVLSLINAERLNTNHDIIYSEVNGNLDNENADNADGFFFTELQATRAAWTTADEGLFVVDQSDDSVYYGGASAWVQLAKLSEVPTIFWVAATGGINYADGNVGIGDTSPDYKLDVNGDINAELNINTVGSYEIGDDVTLAWQDTGNLLVGQGILANDAAIAGTYNTLIGCQVAGVTANLSGNRNIGIGGGLYVLNDITTGDDNIAMGYNALGNLTTGSQNIAIGYNIMSNGVVTGNNNVAIGHQAGRDMTAGDYNIMIGYATAISMPNASYNIAIGYYAMNSSAMQNASNSNIAIGNYALDAITLASLNVCIGGSTGTAITSGTGNTCIGQGAGNTITTGLYNTCIGWGSGIADGTVNNSTAIGYNSSANVGGIVSIGGATQPVVISANWAVPSDATLNNSSICYYLDTTDHNLMVKVKYTDGTIKTGTVCALA